ncbi:MAG TPA: ATP-binding protein, partial [Planctomycetaceae bacterium]|nr:ATP-binding protein [Planctomycetaceae bacterium]
ALEQSARELERRNLALQQSEENLRRQTEILESILRSLADGVVVADEEGRFLVWNPAAERIIGMGPEDQPTAAWPNLYGLYQPDRKTPFPAKDLPLARAMRGEEVSEVAMFIRNDRKSEGAFLSLNATPLRDAQGNVRGGVAVFRDVTRQHAADEALRHSEDEIRSKNQDLETLLYVTSHDLREPLRAIENFSKLVCDRYSDKLDATGQDFLERVVKGAQRLDRLLEDVLTLSRVQRTVQPACSLDSAEVVDDVLRQLETRIRETRARVDVVGPLPPIRADRRWATQAVQNLVSNALKYTREGEPPQVEIRAYEGVEGIGLAVCDRGLGVPPAYAERIFGLFQRAVHRNIEGTGAGLAIVRRVAERHGGRAWVRPREGGGSEFMITFGPGAAA